MLFLALDVLDGLDWIGLVSCSFLYRFFGVNKIFLAYTNLSMLDTAYLNHLRKEMVYLTLIKLIRERMAEKLEGPKAELIEKEKFEH